MGLDIYGSIIIGTSIEVMDLYNIIKVLNTKCKHCKDEYERGAKFCSSCGMKLHQINKMEAKPQVLELLQYLKYYVNEETTWDDIENFLMDNESGCLFRTNPYQDIGYQNLDNENFILGVKLVITPSNRDSRNYPLPVSLANIDEAKKKVILMSNIIGIKNQDINIYPVIYYSS
jgi:hypothetical protein